MKFIRNEHDKFRLQCEHYFHVTHGGDCCNKRSKLYECKGYPCYIEMNNEMLDMLEDNNITWAVQNLQSDNVFTKIIAQFIFSEPDNE